jgi:hypothetical protein
VNRLNKGEKMIKKIIEKLFKKKTKIGGYDLDDKGTATEASPVFYANPTTTTNSTIKDIKIVPSDPKDVKVVAEKESTSTLDKKPQAKKPGRPKGSGANKKQGTPAKKNTPQKKK